MNETERLLWDRLKSFEIGDPRSSFSFSDRLARENRWPKIYALRVIFEYKRFIFLAATSPQSVTPSDEVDQAWHLHLIYTRSYWLEMCREILEQDIHHGPTKGVEERSRFEDCYAYTLARYKEVFAEVPPADIWPPSEVRFRLAAFSRVDTAKYWLLPKPKFLK